MAARRPDFTADGLLVLAPIAKAYQDAATELGRSVDSVNRKVMELVSSTQQHNAMTSAEHSGRYSPQSKGQ